MISIVSIDSKRKVCLNAVGHTINLACDSNDRKVNERGQAAGSLAFSKKSTDDDKKKLFKQILDIIAHVSVTKIKRTETETLPELISCQRDVGENTSNFASRYTAIVAK